MKKNTPKSFEIWSKGLDICPAVASYEENARFIDNKEIVVPESEVTIVFDYPLTNEATLTFKRKGGFTRRNFYKAVTSGYRKIYASEEDPGTYADHGGTLLNRMPSEGPYGIWGHCIEDLVLVNARRHEVKGKVYYTIGVDS